MRRVRDLGEFDLIARIESRVTGDATRAVVLGIGDDAALLRAKPGEELVVTSDVLVEAVHFRWETQSPHAVGRRALAVNLSDLAAMGARPLACTLSLSVPGELPLRQFDALGRGFAEEARSARCPLVGGNLSRASETTLAVTALGTVERGRALRRHGRIRPGDRIFVTGTLGGAALARLRAERDGVRIRRPPPPRLVAGRRLVRLGAVSACIDVSDGLVADLSHLLEGTSFGASVDCARVPRPRGFAAACARLGLDSDALCLAGGEDYELLFCLRGSTGRRLAVRELSRRLGVAVAEIGSVTRRPGVAGLPTGLCAEGWRHF